MGEVCHINRSGAVFAARSVCIARTMLSQDACLSVTRRYYVETAKHITKLFQQLTSHTILVCLYQTLW